MALPPEPIDLEALKLEAESLDGTRTVVSRAWLKRVHQELSVLHELRSGLERVFGGQRIK